MLLRISLPCLPTPRKAPLDGCRAVVADGYLELAAARLKKASAIGTSAPVTYMRVTLHLSALNTNICFLAVHHFCILLIFYIFNTLRIH